MAPLKEQELRPCYCEMGYLSKADGSAFYTQGKTCILAGIFGPVEVRQQREMIDRATLEVTYRPKQGLPNVGDRSKEQIIRNTLDASILTALYRRLAVVINLQELHDGGGLLACCVNAACMALMDAAVPMRFQVAAVTVGVTNEGHFLLDPDSKQAENLRATLTLVLDSESMDVVTSQTDGRYSQTDFQNSLNLAKGAAKKIFAFYREAMKKKYSQEPKETQLIDVS